MDIYEEVRDFYLRYRGEKCLIGKSEEGRGLFAFFVGERKYPAGICQCAMHAREWITARLGLAQIARGLPFGGAWVIPLVNPDGALLCTQGLQSVSPPRRSFLRGLNGGEDFSLWKANACGVDLNVNFDARWGTGAKNIRFPASENYIGASPFCAAESAALRDFTLRVRPQFTVSYHTKGEEIYWKFHQSFFRRRRDFRLARKLSALTGYPLRDAPRSAGGYKDWCIQRLKIPAFTVEVGQDALSHPLGEEAVSDIVQKNADALSVLAKEWI